MMTSITQPTNTATCSYDAVGQLTNVAHTAHPSESYTYDPAGNVLTSPQFSGSATIGSCNRPSQVGDLALTWDAEGNLIAETDTSTGDRREFYYDHRNQLIRVDAIPNGQSTATVASFEYDFLGRLMSRTVSGQKTWILHDRDMPIAEFLDGETQISAMFFYAPDQIDKFFGVWRAGVGDRWFLLDNIKSVRGVIDEQATPLAWVDYDSFGNIRGATPAGLDTVRFAGRIWNDATGLYDNRRRSYSPTLGRFVQEDPLGFAPGDLNLYRYVGNNPLIATDPFGTTTALEYAADWASLTTDIVGYTQVGACVRDMFLSVNIAFTGSSAGGGGACLQNVLPNLIPLGPILGPLATGIPSNPGDPNSPPLLPPLIFGN